MTDTWQRWVVHTPHKLMHSWFYLHGSKFPLNVPAPLPVYIVSTDILEDVVDRQQRHAESLRAALQPIYIFKGCALISHASASDDALTPHRTATISCMMVGCRARCSTPTQSSDTIMKSIGSSMGPQFTSAQVYIYIYIAH